MSPFLRCPEPVFPYYVLATQLPKAHLETDDKRRKSGEADGSDIQALTASFILRLPLLSEAGLLPSSMLKSLKALPNFGRWMDAVCADEHVNFKFDGESVAKGTRERVEGMKKVGGK